VYKGKTIVWIENLKYPARIPHPLVGGDELQELENI
jgi:hypothetical protein